MREDEIRRAEQTWDSFDMDLARRVAWTSLKPIAETGSLDLPPSWDPTRYLHSQLRDRALAMVSASSIESMTGCALVCGDMSAERYFFEPRDFVRFTDVDGFDLSSKSLQKVQLNGVAFNPHHVDCNHIELKPNRYDLIVGHHGLHHIQELSRLFEQAHRALKPSGLLFLSEWIGPNYLQIPILNKWISIALLYVFFPSRKMRTNHMGRTKGFGFIQYKKEIFDPSEACNSEVLEVELTKRFRYLKSVHFGGLCYPMFEGNAIHLDEKDAAILKRVNWVIKIERLLTRWGIIKPLFVVGICEKKSDTIAGQ